MEKLMQYIWHHRLWNSPHMMTVDGRRLLVIDPGKLNTDAGPDFFNAKIKIDGELWIGNVEIHVRASDWFRHHHDDDPAYDSVILHVVEKDDAEVKRLSTKETIPQVRMVCSKEFVHHYSDMVGRADLELPCTMELSGLSPIYITDWITALLYERLGMKSERVEGILNLTANNWESACYVTLARALGTGVNGDSFERLAMSLPLRFIRKHSDSLLSIESLLFGQAGLLKEENFENPYYTTLKREYEFLSNKFGLQTPESLNWKMARMRPASFPHRRIAILASYLHGGFMMMSRILEIENVEEAMSIFNVELSGFWSNHYNFKSGDSNPSKRLSDWTINSLVINVVVPVLYSYGLYHPSSSEGEAYIEKAIDLLESIRGEKNHITTLFSKAGISSKNAFTSQALIQLRRNYCEMRKCLFCRFGHRFLAAKAIRNHRFSL
ncbi:MAG: DUF2851 family protein [Muribaculaceae bacterium]|nr:DUF2851 family protein [Muribaculaceae bacterium]